MCFHECTALPSRRYFSKHSCCISTPEVNEWIISSLAWIPPSVGCCNLGLEYGNTPPGNQTSTNWAGLGLKTIISVVVDDRLSNRAGFLTCLLSCMISMGFLSWCSRWAYVNTERDERPVFQISTREPTVIWVEIPNLYSSIWNSTRLRECFQLAPCGQKWNRKAAAKQLYSYVSQFENKLQVGSRDQRQAHGYRAADRRFGQF